MLEWTLPSASAPYPTASDKRIDVTRVLESAEVRLAKQRLQRLEPDTVARGGEPGLLIAVPQQTVIVHAYASITVVHVNVGRGDMRIEIPALQLLGPRRPVGFGRLRRIDGFEQ